MKSRERVMSCFERKGYDRIPIKHEGTPEINNEIKKYFGVKNNEQMLIVLGDDFRYIEPEYVGPELKVFPDGSKEGYFGERYEYKDFGAGRYLEAVYLPYADVDNLKDLDRSHFPNVDWLDYSNIAVQAEEIHKRGYVVCAGSAGDMDFINGISRIRGMEQVLIDMIENNEVFLEIMDARYEFYYKKHERMLKEARGLIDIMHVGDDLGNQLSQMISFDVFDRFFAPKYGKYFDMVHKYGARTMMHMCGTVWAFLPRLIKLGLDIYDVVQPTTPENDIGELVKKHGQELVFKGSMDVQKEIAFGTTEDVKREVKRRLSLFPKGGLIMGPSHAIQANSPIENVVELYRTAGSLMENIPQWVYDVKGKPKKIESAPAF
jgi:uroporphyrinogen decarboxylase